jgi:hypothetical protein
MGFTTALTVNGLTFGEEPETVNMEDDDPVADRNPHQGAEIQPFLGEPRIWTDRTVVVCRPPPPMRDQTEGSGGDVKDALHLHGDLRRERFS